MLLFVECFLDTINRQHYVLQNILIVFLSRAHEAQFKVQGYKLQGSYRMALFCILPLLLALLSMFCLSLLLNLWQ